MSAFEDLLTRLRGDVRIVGVVLGGSRGKGFAVAGSDWDVYVIVADGVSAADMAGVTPGRSSAIEVCAVLTLGAFAEYAAPGRPEEWDAYNFAHVTPVFDRTDGELAALCEAKEWLPPDLASTRAAHHLDAYVNSHYRTVKNARSGLQDAAALDAADSVGHLLDVVFTAERRIRPYNKYLAWELDHHPLDRTWWGDDNHTDSLLTITRGDVRASQEVFERVEREARSVGFADVLDAWGAAALRLMRGA